MLFNHFTILVPAYNCEKWVSLNLNSIVKQKYENYNIVYVDDCSTDNTTSVVEKFDCERISLIKNSFNKGKTENIYHAIHSMSQESIVVLLDGDDWLVNRNVLSYLNEVYNSGEIWMTNGSYVIDPSGQVVRPMTNKQYWLGNVRQKSWQFSHLGTFRKELFCKIKRKDLMDKQGQFWATTSDQAIMWPMVEMSGPEHHRAIDEVLYVYNRSNPLSDDRAHREDQLLTERIIRTKDPYQRLVSL